MDKNRTKILFSTESYKHLAIAIADHLYTDEIRLPLISEEIEFKEFPDGESYHKLPDVSDRDVILIGGTITEKDTMEIYDLGSGLASWHARSITFVIPYFGYSTMERYVKPGEIVKAKNRARLLSSIPHGAIRNQFIFIDLHAAGIPEYFEGNVSTTHLYAEEIVLDICKKIGTSCKNGYVLGSTDAGRAKWIETYASKLKTNCAIIIKRRDSGKDTEVVGINADVKDKDVIIYDDMIRTGGSLIKAAEAYKKHGANKVYAIATHGILPGDSLSTIFESGAIEKVFVTDTHPTALKWKKLLGEHHIGHGVKEISFAKKHYQVVSIAELIAKSISKSIVTHKPKAIHI